MKVRATRIGFFNHIRRREGDVFTIPDTPRRKLSDKDANRIEFEPVKDKAGTVPAAFGTWMEPVGAREPEKTSTAQEALNKASDDLKAGKGARTGELEVI